MSGWSSFEITATALAVLAILVAIYFGIRSTRAQRPNGNRVKVSESSGSVVAGGSVNSRKSSTQGNEVEASNVTDSTVSGGDASF